MGRFYKTAKPEMLDFMFKVPEQAIMTAIKGADAQLEGQEAYLTDLQKQLKTAALDEDEERRKQRVTELEGKIREHSLKIWENPLLAIKEQKGIKDLGQEIYKDLTEGELYAYNTNYTTRQKYYEKAVEDATGKDGRLNVDQVKNAMAAFDAQYNMKGGAQFNKETGKFNPYGTELLYDYVDRSEYAKKTAEGWVTQDTKNWSETLEGQYWKKEEVTKSILGLDELTLGILNTMTTDETVMQPLIQGLQHQAKIKAAQILKASGGDFNKLYKQEFDKLYIEYFGEKDEATGKLKLEPVLNEDGTPAIDETTKKPIMQFKNPGKLYQEAKAAADKKDKNEIGIGISYTADEFAKINLTKQRELENEKEMERFRNPIAMDSNTGEFMEVTFEGKTLEEAEAGLDKQLISLSNSVVNYKDILIKTLGQGKNKEELEQIRDKLDKLFPQDGEVYLKPNFAELETYLASQGFAGDKDATGVKTFKNQWNSTYADWENKNETLNILKKQAKENMPDADKAEYNLQKDYEAQARKNLSDLKEALAITKKGGVSKFGNEDRINKLIANEQSIINNSRQKQKTIISKNLNLNPEAKNNKNLKSFATQRTRGNVLIEYGVPEEKAYLLDKVLKETGKTNIFSLFGGASAFGTYIRNETGTGMIGFNNTVIGKYFSDQASFKQTWDETTQTFTITDKDNKVVLTGNVGNYYVALDDLDKVGQNAIATTIVGEQMINGKPQKVTFDLYTNQLSSSTVTDALNTVRDEIDYAAFLRKGERAATQVNNDPEFVFKSNSNRVRYSKSSTGEALVSFYDDNGTFIQTVGAKSPQAYKAWKSYK